jgi:hypothetical protein
LDDRAITLRDSKFDRKAWTAFLGAVRAGEFDFAIEQGEIGLVAPDLTQPSLTEDALEDADPYETPHPTLRLSYREVCERLRRDRGALEQLLKSLDAPKRAALRQRVAERRLVLVRAQMVEGRQGDSWPPPGRFSTAYPRQTRGPDTADGYMPVRPRAVLAA